MPDRRLRIAVLARAVHPLHGIGGLERHVYDLCRHLVAEHAHVTLITKPPTTPSVEDWGDDNRGETTPSGSEPGPTAVPGPADRFGLPSEAFRVLTVPYVTFPGAGRRKTTVLDRVTAYPVFGWRAGRLAATLVGRGQIDLVHALGASGLGYARARRQQMLTTTAPFVLNPQGLEEFGATDPQRARLKRAAYTPLQIAVRTCARAADVVIATDRALTPTVLQHLPVDASRVVVIPNAIDLAMLDRGRDTVAGAALRARFGLAADTPILLSVGRLEENKGFHVAARAFGELLRREAQPPTASTRRDWRWVLVGDGPYRSAIERVAAAEGLGSRMIVAGRASDEELHAWYETATLFVHPTLYEGSSLVTLEAMAHGRAVIATRAGGLTDKVFPRVNGWIVEPDRADLLTDAFAEALGAAVDLARMGQAGRTIVERDFAWPVVAARLMAVYGALTQLVTEKNQPRITRSDADSDIH